jgi:hypothetical protein
MIKLLDIPLNELPVYVGLLTIEQKDSLINQTFDSDSYFNPIQDINDNWVISTQEMLYCENPDFVGVKELPLIVYEPKPTPPWPPVNE